MHPKRLYLPILILLASCSTELPHEAPFDPDSPATKQAKATLKGKVALQGETDAGGAAVSLVNAERAYNFTTANDGAVFIPGIVPGAYRLTVSSRYFAPLERELELTLGESKDFGALTLALATSKVSGSALALSLEGKEESLVGGVKIVLTKTASIRSTGGQAPAYRAAAEATGTTTYTAVSAPDGAYSIDGVAAGEYTVTASNADVPAQDEATVTVTGEGDVTVEDVLLAPLTGYFSIQGTAADGPSELYTNTPNVSLELAGFNAAKVKIGRAGGGSCTYPNPAVTLDANLPYVIPAPGIETVCVRFIDAAGKETSDIRGAIVYDNAPPKLASAVINDGALATGSLSVGVRFSAVETETTLHAYQLVNALPTDWNTVPKYAYQPSVLHSLAGQGLQTVYARFQDAAGNWAGPVSASIEVSTVAPTGTAELRDDQGSLIAVGATTRASRVYVVSSIASQTTLQMQVSTSGSYTGVAWEPYAAAKAVDLPPQSGYAKETRQVSARVRDAVGRVLDLVNAQTFYIDSRGPAGTVSAPGLVNTLDVPLVLSVNDPEAIVEVAENPAFLPSQTFAFTPATTYTLTGDAQGQRTLYVQYLDAAGNASPLYAAVLQVDTVPPELAAVVIRQGALTASRTVDLDLTALNAADMSVAEDTVCSGPWQAYTATRQLTFAADVDGDKTIAVKFRDAALNETACLTKTVTYDKTAPVPGPFLINGGAPYARDRAVTLAMTVDSDATAMQLSESAVFSGAWQPVTTSIGYTLSSGDGEKRLYLMFRDAAGNTAQATPAVIRLDTVAPEQPLVTVGDGSGYARQVTAALTLSATGSPSHYRWTADGVIDNKPWLAFTTSTSVSLGAGNDGARTVAVQFKDLAENLSLAAQANVYLDRQSPSAPSIRADDGAATTRSSAGLVTLTLNAADTGSGLSIVRLAPTLAALATAAELAFEPTKLYTLDNNAADGIKTVWASFYDKAGNYSAPVSAVIRLDRTAPAATIAFPAGDLSSTGVVPVTLAADADTTEMLLSNDIGFAGAAWEPFEPAFTYTFPLVEGPTALFARFRDDAGNESGTFSLGLTIDTSPPVLQSVSAAVVSDTLVWDDLGTGVTSYTVQLLDQGVAISATTVTAKRLYVGRMNPGFTVVANFADGSQSAYSQGPGFAVPPTFSAFLGLRAGERSNARLASLAQAYGLGTTTTGCAQVVFTSNEWDDKTSPAGGPAGGTTSGMLEGCRGSNVIRLLAEEGYYESSPPPFDAQIAPVTGSPFTGLPPLRISSGGRSYYYSPSGNPLTPLLAVPGWLKWPGANYPSATTGDVVAAMGQYDPSTGNGSNEVRFYVPLSAMAVTDDVTITFGGPVTPLTAYGYLGNQGLEFAASGKFAGIDVTHVDYRNRYYESFLTFNELWDFSQNKYPYNRPGAVRLPFYASDGTYGTDTLSAASIWSHCTYEFDPLFNTWDYVCSDRGQAVELDLAASELRVIDNDPYWNENYRVFTVSNGDGSRTYGIPFPNDSVTTFHWRDEYEQAAFEPYLRAAIRKVAAPVRVRGTGFPLLTNNVSGVSEMLVGLDASFTGAVWQAYAAEVTLPEGTQTVWVKYRDEAGNTTNTQSVVIAAPVEAPRLDEVVILGSKGNPFYTTGANVTAYMLGTFPSNVWVRASTSSAFQDEGWVATTPLTELEVTDPLTGETETAELDDMQIVALPLTIPDAPGTYTYYFWVKDASRNFSRMQPGAIIYDASTPDAEFSLKTGEAGDVLFQARWTVTKSPFVPSLAALSPAPATTYALPFTVPFLGTYAGTLWIDTAKACLQVGYLNACPLSKLTNIDDHSVSISSQQATVIWRGHGPYESPVTTAATIFADGSVRLSYWNTGARIPMYGEVDLVETPYADYQYAAVQGSVEYRPNKLPMQFLLKSHTGKIEKVSVGNARVDVFGAQWSVQSPWRSLQVDDRGIVRYTGTAYSMAGAAGSVTVRDVYVASGGQDSAALDNLTETPLTETRRWLSWDLGADHFTTAFRVNGVSEPKGALAGGYAGGNVRVSESHQRLPYRYERTNAPWGGVSEGRYAAASYGEPLVLVDDARIPASGAPVSPDFEARLLYGADGSIWDLSDPREPAPLRTFSGTYPPGDANALRVGQYLWTQGGVWDISSPEAPVRVGNTGSPRSVFATYRGLVYEFEYYSYWVYTPSGTLLSSGGMATNPAGSSLFRTGARMLTATWDQFAIDLSTPLTPDSVFITSGFGSYFFVDADVRASLNWPVAASGFLRYTIGNSGGIIPRFGDIGAEGAPLPWQARGISAEGPWVFGVEGDAVRIGHAGRSLPMKNRRIYVGADAWSWPLVAADHRYTYVCDGTRLYLYGADGTLQKSGQVKGCNGAFLPLYPWVLIDVWRYRVDGATVIEDPLTFCDPFSSSGYCPQADPLGTAFRTWDNKLYVGADNQIALSDTSCEPRGATGSLIYCYNQATQDIKAAPFSILAYRGVVTGPSTLPAVKILNDGGQFVDAEGEHFSTSIGTYWVESLLSVKLVGPGQLRFMGPGLASDGMGRMYQLDRDRMRPIAAVDGASQVVLNAAGVLVSAQSTEVWQTRWGPAAPEFRLRLPELAGARDIAHAAGYVYVATPTGLARTNGLTHAATAVDRPDLTINHRGDRWELRGPDLRPVTTAVAAPGADTGSLCSTVLKHTYKDPNNPWNPPYEDVCGVVENLPAARIFEGDLGRQWLGLRDLSVDAIGFVSSLAVDTAGRVYAGVQTGATGVYMYDPADVSLSQSEFLATGPVLDVAVADNRLYVVTAGGDLTAYDMSAGFAVLWTYSSGYFTRVRATTGYVGANADGWGGPEMLDPDTGAFQGGCGGVNADFEFAKRRWGGQLRTVVVGLSWSSVNVIEPITCQYVEQVYVPSSAPLRSLRRQSGFLVVGAEDGEVYITQEANLTQRPVWTILAGADPMVEGVIVGPFVYTIGGDAGGLFQLH